MNRIRFLALLLLASCAGSAFAQSAPATSQWPAWEQLSPAQRDLLLAPLRDRWNADPAGRAILLEHAQRWRQLTPEQRARAHHGLGRWERMDPQQRDTMRALFHKMRDMTPEQRRALREQWHAMSQEQRRAWVHANAPAGD